MNYPSPYKESMLKKIYEGKLRKQSKAKVLLPQLKSIANPDAKKSSPYLDLKKVSRSPPPKNCKCEFYQEKISSLQKEKRNMIEIHKKTLQLQKEKDLKIRQLEKEVKILKREKSRALKIIEYLKQKLSEKIYHDQADSHSSIYIETQYPEDPFENMTYEQLLELGERIGNVSRGFSRDEIRKIPKAVFQRREEEFEEKCAVCYTEYEEGDKIRKLQPCGHFYHSKCIRDWLIIEKKCPVCQTEVVPS